jgi:site-specific DNA-methyltransferase (adenine-specific)
MSAEIDSGLVRFGDCLELMPEFPGLESVDLLLTDPPYRIAANLNGRKSPISGRREKRGFGARFDKHYDGGFVPFRRWLARAVPALVPGANVVIFENPLNLEAVRRSVLASGLKYNGFGVWYATGRSSNMNRRPFSNFDVWVWASKPGRPYFYADRAGLADVLVAHTENNYVAHHGVPGAKPVSILRRLIHALCPEGGLVFDPFLGSGSTGRAAREEGMRWAGCEIGGRLRDTVAARALVGYPPLSRWIREAVA